MAKLLVTGAGGMVGRNILEHPLVSAWDVVAPRRSEVDLADRGATLEFFRSVRPDAVVHAAGHVGGIAANMANPVSFLVDNVEIGVSVIMAAREVGVPRLVNLASSCMYPRNAPNPLSEDLILTGELEPTNEGYAIAKTLATRLCQYIRRETPDLLYKTLIPCNLYGRFDKFDSARAHLVPAAINKIHRAKLEGSDVVEIWGDGSARREFMYAGDLADAVMRALADLAQLPDLMNIGLGEDHSVDDYYAAAAAAVGWHGRFVHDPTKPAGMQRKLTDIRRQTAWGWAPRHTLADGLLKTYQYYLEELS